MKRTFIIGDIHGCYDEFIELTKQIGITDTDLIISVGDIVDRGNKSLELYHYFKNTPNTIVLMGNHERKHQNKIFSYAQEIVKLQFGDEYEGFIEWVSTFKYYYEAEDAIIVHAFYEHDKTLEEQKEEVLAGTTSGSKYLEKKYKEDNYWSDYYTGEKPIIYGHHVVGDSPKIKNNTYGIDTGACHAGMLTALELPGFKIHQVQVKRDYWKEEQAKWQIPVLEAKNWEEMKILHIHKQIEKLRYKQETEVVDFLDGLEQWIGNIELTFERIKDEIEKLNIELQEKFKDEFNREVGKMDFRNFIFKARANNLKLSDLQKVLDTPEKVLALATKLNLPELPDRM